MEGPLPDIITGAAPENSTHVYFKDMIVAASDDSEEESEPSERGGTNHSGERKHKVSAAFCASPLHLFFLALAGQQCVTFQHQSSCLTSGHIGTLDL